MPKARQSEKPPWKHVAGNQQNKNVQLSKEQKHKLLHLSICRIHTNYPSNVTNNNVKQTQNNPCPPHPSRVSHPSEAPLGGRTIYVHRRKGKAKDKLGGDPPATASSKRTVQLTVSEPQATGCSAEGGPQWGVH